MLFSLPISFFYAQVETNFPLHLKSSFSDYLSIVASMTSVKAVLAICLQFWLVKITERLPTHHTILLSYACFVVTGLIYGLSHLFWFLLVAQLFLVVGESVGLTRLLQLVSTIAPPDKRGLYFSLYGIHWDISRTVGPVLGSFILMQHGGMSLFILASVLLLTGCLAQFIWIKRMVPLQ
ncbi:MFS transporter [Brevibacillus sp. SYSU BS000544]|uniref:MFS transporter n=1 Tax=Brevibacillus sp. SYSU BS000544 TaxID=3416443 RepID=UPI003CE50EB7